MLVSTIQEISEGDSMSVNTEEIEEDEYENWLRDADSWENLRPEVLQRVFHFLLAVVKVQVPVS